jgi:hypothetical protein
MKASLVRLSLGLSLVSATARADDPPTPADAAATADDDDTAETPDDDATAELQDKIDDLEARLSRSEESQKSRFPVHLSGYGDVGYFSTQGDGTGYRRDIGHSMFPSDSQYGWVFYGDLLATQVNSRGDVADLGSAPGVDRFDSIHSQGNPTFLVNELNLTVTAGLGSRALFTASTNFTPRSGANFALGDSFDVDLVNLEWMPFANGKTSIWVGKFDSVIGHEYKWRKSPDRFGITPSLVARYTTGTAVGVKGRTLLAGDHIILAAAVTNGSFGTEQFHFYDEVDTNAFKTLSGRAALRLPIGTGGSFEAGPSGSWGTQDGVTTGGGKMWFYGVDAVLDLMRVVIKAQWLKGKAPGDPVHMVYSLDLKGGGYVETNVLLTPIIGLLGRVEYRDALVAQAMDRLYITKNWRAVGGVRLQLNPKALIKAEYAHNGEYGGTPSIPDDVVTTSVVMAF